MEKYDSKQILQSQTKIRLTWQLDKRAQKNLLFIN